jgi:dCMP deaminase
MKKDKILNIAKILSENISRISEDPYTKVGAIVLNKDGRVLSLGYNGLAPNKNVQKSFWENRDTRRKYMIHAEMNALSCISRYDDPYYIYVNLLPCGYCANLIASYGIKEVFYNEEYHLDSSSKEIFKFYKIKSTKYN